MVSSLSASANHLSHLKRSESAIPGYFLMLDTITSFSEGELSLWHLFPDEYIPLIYVSLTIYTIPLNSALNPLVYICRIERLRRFTRRLLLCEQNALSLPDTVKEEEIKWRSTAMPLTNIRNCSPAAAGNAAGTALRTEFSWIKYIAWYLDLLLCYNSNIRVSDC